MKKQGERLTTNSKSKSKARVFLVDDHPVLRQGVAALIAGSADLEVCGEAATAAEALENIPSARPDVAVVDITLPGANGVELIRDLRVRHPRLAVMVYSMHDERFYAERVIRAGARGYVMKQSDPTQLLEGLRAVLRGELFVSEQLQKTLLKTLLEAGPRGGGKRGVDRLSDRELQVFEAIGRGRTMLQIADDLHLSPKTVETYRANILRKLGIENSHQLLHTAIRWVESGELEEPPKS